MNTLITQLSQYLRDALGATPEIAPWNEEAHLALFLRDRYRFFEAHVPGNPCLLMADRAMREAPAATIRKHISQVQARWPGPVIYVRERITAYNRKRLLEQRIPFVVPGNQMYLPMLGIDFREHFRKPRRPAKSLRPSSQAVLLLTMYHDALDMGPTALAERLGYSVMAMSQAMDELEAAGLVESTSTGRGRSRCLRFSSSKQEVWKLAEPVLSTPVKSRHAVHLGQHENLPGPQAGLSALAHFSMLADPDNATAALNRQDWKLLQQSSAAPDIPADDPDATCIEVWAYDPALFAIDGCVDRLSLYLSLRDATDERVQSALDQILEDVAW